MDYSIQAEVNRRARNLAMAKTVARECPGAEVVWLDKERSVYASPFVQPTRVCIMPGDNVLNLVAYIEVPFSGDVVRVYLGDGYGGLVRSFFSDQTLSPDVRAALIALVKP